MRADIETVLTRNSPVQGSLLDDVFDTDEAIEAELKQLLPASPQPEPRQSPKRASSPPQFPRTVLHHEPENTQCACGCQLQRMGEGVGEKLDHTPGVFTVEQHVRNFLGDWNGKLVCDHFAGYKAGFEWVPG